MEANFCELKINNVQSRPSDLRRTSTANNSKMWGEFRPHHMICCMYQNKLLSVVCILLMTVLSPVSGRICTVLKSRKTVNEVTRTEPCIQSYKTSCSWFSSKQCTFYEHTYCEKAYNETKTFYLIVTECCPGFTQLPNRTCLKIEGYHDEEEDDGIPHGVFAAIACGAIFIICITVLIVINIKKNEKKKMMLIKENVKYKDQKVKMLPVDVPTVSIPTTDSSAEMFKTQSSSTYDEEPK